MSYPLGPAKAMPKSLLMRVLLCVGVAAAIWQLVGITGTMLGYTNVIPTARMGVVLGTCGADHFCPVMRIKHGGAADKAGLRADDQLSLDAPIDVERLQNYFFLPGNRIGGTLRRNGGFSHVEMVAITTPWTEGHLSIEISDLIMAVVQILIVMIAFVLLMRAGGRLSVALLGTSLICMNAYIPIWAIGSRLGGGVSSAFCDALAAASPLLLLGFARAFVRETTDGNAMRVRVPFIALIAITAIWTCIAEVLGDLGRLPPPSDFNITYMTASTWASFWLANFALVLSVLVLAAGWRKASAADRPRYRYIVPALMLLVTMPILGPLPNIIGGWDPTQNPIVLAMNVLPLVGLLLLAYAVLRHRVIDLGFAVNRTLVYGVVSAMLLGVFGLTEWAVDHFVPIEGREKNALVDAAIGLVVFLTFHRVRDFVEEGIERLFFNRWHHADARLRRFLHEGAFFTEPRALSGGFVQALSRYSGGAEAALYLRNAKGYECIAGEVTGIAPHLPLDLHPLVKLRAEPVPTEVDDPALPADLIAPMLNRSEVIGFAMLGAKLSGEQFRPDEIELIGTATRQVGQDLHALKVEQLELDGADLRRENVVLRSLVTATSLPAM